MWNNFIGEQIRRTNRNLLMINLLIVVVVITYACLSAGYLKQAATQGQQVSPEALARMGASAHHIFEVDSTEVMASGYQEVERKNGSEKAVADFLVMRAGDHMLIVKTSPGKHGPHFTGNLETIPGDLSAALSRDIKSPQTRAAILPVMLETTAYSNEAWLALVFGVPLLLIGTWNLKKWMSRASDPALSPIVTQLQHRGGMMACQQVDSEMAQGPEKVGKAIFTKSWVVVPNTFGTHIMHFDDVVWVYKKVTQHRVNFIPTGKTYAAMICSSMGKTIEVSGKEGKIDELLTAVTEKAPWAIPGFSDEAQALWSKNRDAMLQAVNARRSALMKRAAQPAATPDPVPTLA